MRKKCPERALFAFTCVMFSVLCPLVASATSTTLTIDAIFSPPAFLGAQEQEPSIEIFSIEPNADENWTSAPLALDQPLPKLAPRGFSEFAYVYRSVRPALSTVGRNLSPDRPLARIRAVNQFYALCSRTSIIPIHNGKPMDDDAIVFFLAPEFSEAFLIPPGEYMVKREVWVEGDEDEVIMEEFSVQELREGWSYSLGMSRREEGRLLQLLSRR